MLIGYARVSTEDQSLDRQIDQLKAAGVKKIYCEKITGTKKDRPKLKEMLDNAREGDTIIVTDLTRISRSTKDLLSLVEEINKRGMHFKSLKEEWINTATAEGTLLLTIFSGLSQFERDLISRRTKEGLASARTRGRLGGRRSKLSDKDKATVKKLYDSKTVTVAEICRTYGISRPTLYKAVKEREDK